MHIRKSALLSLLALALATGWLAKSLAQKPTPRVWLYKSSESAAALAKGPSVKIAEDRAGNGVYTIMMARRTKAGEVELHSLDTDIFYVINGDATFISGGKAEGMKPTGDNEERGTSISGGETRHLHTGNIITIPNGLPHWFQDVKGTFTYFVVKVR